MSMDRKSDRNDGNRGNARSNEREGGRLSFLRQVYMSSHARIEAKFLAMIRARNLSMRDREFSLMSFREGAVEILSAVERVFGAEGIRDVSKHLRARENPAADHDQVEDDGDEECDEEGEDDYVQTPIDDTPWTYEKIDPKGVDPWEHLRGMPRFPFELIDKDEGEPCGPEPEDEEEDEEEEIELDIIERVANWDEVRGLWKDFDPAFR
jgi:hypothetical protein